MHVACIKKKTIRAWSNIRMGLKIESYPFQLTKLTAYYLPIACPMSRLIVSAIHAVKNTNTTKGV